MFLLILKFNDKRGFIIEIIILEVLIGYSILRVWKTKVEKGGMQNLVDLQLHRSVRLVYLLTLKVQLPLRQMKFFLLFGT